MLLTGGPDGSKFSSPLHHNKGGSLLVGHPELSSHKPQHVSALQDSPRIEGRVDQGDRRGSSRPEVWKVLRKSIALWGRLGISKEEQPEMTPGKRSGRL